MDKDKGETCVAPAPQCCRASAPSSSSKQQPPTFTNQQLIPIYTEWSNRYLLKQQLKPIHDLTYELREPKTLINLVHSVTFGCPGTSQSTLFCSLNATEPVEKVDRCLKYLASLGVNVSNCRAQDLLNGHLGEILALIFALSHYKQQQKALNLVTASPQHIPRLSNFSPKVSHASISQVKPTQILTQSSQKPSGIAKMSTTKLRRPLGSTSSLAETTPTKSNLPTTSKLLAPTRRVGLNATSTEAQEPKSIQTRLPSAPPAANRLKPPTTTTTTTKLQKPAQQSNKPKVTTTTTTQPNSNVTSLVSSTSSSTSSSAASFSSVLATTSGATLTKSQLKPPKSLRPPTATTPKKVDQPVAVEKPKAIQKVEAPPSTAPPSKMLKLFGKNRKPSTEASTNLDSIESKSPAGIRRGLKPPTSGLLVPTTIEKSSTNPAQMSKKPQINKPELRLPSARNEDEKSKRTSKSSEEDSGFGNSAAVSLNSSNSSLSSGSNIRQHSVPPLAHPETIPETIIETNSESVDNDSGITSDAASSLMTKPDIQLKPQPQSTNSSQLKPTLAVKAITLTKRSASADKPSKLKPAFKIESTSNNQNELPTTPVPKFAVEKKVEDVNVGKTLKKPTVPIRKTSRLQQAETEFLADEIPDPPPQLKIASAGDGNLRNNVPTTTNITATQNIEEPVSYVNIRKSADQSLVKFQNEEFAEFGAKNKMPKIKQLIRPPSSTKQMDHMEGLHRTMRFGSRRRDYVADSCEDSSSISSGISDNNFEDVSTDDLSDHQMTAATGPYGEYHKADLNRPRTSNGLNSSILEPQRLNQRRIVQQQQNVVQELLQRSRSSQRSVAFSTTPNLNPTAADYERVYHTVHVPSSSIASPNRFGSNSSTQLLLSQDGETLSVSRPSTARPSLRSLAQHSSQIAYPNHHASAANGQQQPPNYNTHSLDRHAHLKQFSNGDLVYEQLSGQVPYRYSVSKPPQQQQIYAAASEYGISQNPRHYYTDMLGQQRRSNGSLSARLPSSNDYAMNLHLQKLSNELNCSPRAQIRMSNTNATLSANTGSQLSLTSSLGSAYSTSEDAYTNMIQRLNDEMHTCRTKLKTVDKDDLQNIIHMFDNKLEVLVKQVEKLQKKSAKEKDIESLMNQIEDLRQLSVNARLTVGGQQSMENGRSHSIETPLDESKRHPSMESVNSYASTKALKDKNGFARNGKKGWIRNSFSRAFTKNKKSKNGGSISECEQSPLHKLKPIAGSTTTLDLTDEEHITLKKQFIDTVKQLQETEKQLGNFQLEALDKAREVDILQNTVARLKNENKLLKHTTIMLERKAMRSESRASSRQSLNLTCCHEEEGYYEQTPSMAERSCSSTSSSKRSSGGLNARVVVCIDLNGQLNFNQNHQELNIGAIPLPSAQTTWSDIDQQLGSLMSDYMRVIDPESKLTLSPGESSIIGYQLIDGQVRDRLSDQVPNQQPSELITPTSIIKLKLRGAAQNALDGVCIESLYPREFLQSLLNLLLQSSRLVINGSTGIGKSGLARYLARYLAARKGLNANQIKNIMFPNENDQRVVQVQQELETLLKSNDECIILIDNIHRRRVELISEAFAVADEYHASNSESEGPYVIITLNRTSDLQLQQMQVNHNVRVYSLYSEMEPIKGMLGRYLRRRIEQDRLTGQCRCAEQLHYVIAFLDKALECVNKFIKNLDASSTIGPRIFLQMPLSMEKSRDWFINLWNSNIIPYMARIVRENDSTIEWRDNDPTSFITDIWPWLDGVGPSLNTVSFELDKPSSRNSSSTSSSVSAIDAIYALDRMAETNRVYQTKLQVQQ